MDIRKTWKLHVCILNLNLKFFFSFLNLIFSSDSATTFMSWILHRLLLMFVLHLETQLDHSISKDLHKPERGDTKSGQIGSKGSQDATKLFYYENQSFSIQTRPYHFFCWSIDNTFYTECQHYILNAGKVAFVNY